MPHPSDTGGVDLDGGAGPCRPLNHRAVQIERRLTEAMTEHLDQIDVGEDVHVPRLGEDALGGEVVLIRLADTAPRELVHDLRVVERPATQPVDGTDQQVPRIW